VYAFGTNLGAAVARGSETACAIVKRLVADARRAEVVGSELRPRLVASEHGALLVVFNRHDQERTEELRFRAASWSRARDLDSGATLAIRDGGLSVSVPGEDVRVFVLEA